ncbi:hypothetical protein BMT55_00025 [Listeria newyorkensis]|uniref:Phage-related protein n=1 Tax=Listeria newyorkensis TaxID=1497681 RepID=A0ABX4XQM1_9LIST|nr:hypothetical protein [Listeria newyorkensis]PNP94780.1 hypothetical protein BMT55_00025 [Listeria newyorkensis]
MSNQKEALEYVANLAQKDIKEVNGRKYATGRLDLVPDARATAFKLHTLTGIVNYVQSNVDALKGPVVVHVFGPEKVSVFSPLNNDREREEFVRADAIVPEFTFDHFYDSDTFNIKMQALFLESDEKTAILGLVGNIKEEDVRNTSSDGVSQTVVAKSGISKVENVTVPNPVSLAPYRTFVEVDQPVSKFVLRMKDGPRIALFEADGGAWQNIAIQNIEKYLVRELDDLIQEGRVHIIA